MRECLQDVFDVPGLTDLMQQFASRQVRVVEVETQAASPFARSLLFGYVGMFLYEGDAPLAERRAQALSLDATLLAELLGSTDLRELLDPVAITATEAELQRLAPDRRVSGVDAVHDLLRVVGDLRSDEAVARGATPRRSLPCSKRLAGRSGYGSPVKSGGWPSKTPGGCATHWAWRSRSVFPRRLPSRFETPSVIWSRAMRERTGPSWPRMLPRGLAWALR